MAWSVEESQLDRAVRMGDYTGELVVDPESPLETLFGLPAMAGGLTVLLSGIYLALAASGILHNASTAAAWPIFWKGVLLTIVGMGVRAMVDVHYKLNEDQRTVTLHRRFLGWRFQKRICSFSDVQGLYIDNIHTREKMQNSSSYIDKYEYGLVMTLQSGKRVRLLERSYTDYDLFSNRIEPVSRMLGVGVHSGDSSSGPLTTIFKVGCLFFVALFLFGTCAHRKPSQNPRRTAPPTTQAVPVRHTPPTRRQTPVRPAVQPKKQPARAPHSSNSPKR